MSFRRVLTGLFGVSHPAWPRDVRFTSDGRTYDATSLAGMLREHDPARDVVFFVHGLLQDEGCWSGTEFDMPQAFCDDLGVITVRVAYDTGRHISDNGADLARGLDEVARAAAPGNGRWHFVGNSMGGLVVRSALFQGERAGLRFVEAVDRVFLLASPHRGSTLEKSVNLAGVLLDVAVVPLRITSNCIAAALRAPGIGPIRPLAPVAHIVETFVHRVPALCIGAVAGVLDLRSDGVRDLCHGYVLEEEWRHDRVLGGLVPRRRPVPAPASARFYAIAGALTEVGPTDVPRLATDGLVSVASAANEGPDDVLRFRERGRFRVHGRTHHLAIPRSRPVFETIREWWVSGA